MFLNPTTPGECANIISGLKKSSQGLGNMPVKLWIEAKNILSGPLSSIINECFSAGYFPKLLKLATITPIFKSGNELFHTDYRPISILPLLSKIYERAMCNRLIKFIHQHSILVPHQYGFRSGRSTIDAVFKLVEYIYSALEEKNSAITVSIDLRKAFDTLNHEILLSKLNHYGIRGIPNQLLRSYLSDRMQRVKIGDVYSTWKEVNIGVPQGGIISPLLFLLYINDLSNVSHELNCILFADDTTIYQADSKLDQLCTNISNNLCKISEWCEINRLSFNLSKTFAMIFNNYRYTPESKINLNNSEIAFESEGRFLGIYIDSKLNFSNHLQNTCLKVSKTVGIFHKLKFFIPSDVLKILYYSLVYPHFTYGVALWGDTYKVHLHPLKFCKKK